MMTDTPDHNEARRVAEWYVEDGASYSDNSGPMNLARCYLDACKETAALAREAMELMAEHALVARLHEDVVRAAALVVAERDRFKAEVAVFRALCETLVEQHPAGTLEDVIGMLREATQERCEHDYQPAAMGPYRTESGATMTDTQDHDAAREWAKACVAQVTIIPETLNLARCYLDARGETAERVRAYKQLANDFTSEVQRLSKLHEREKARADDLHNIVHKITAEASVVVAERDTLVAEVNRRDDERDVARNDAQTLATALRNCQAGPNDPRAKYGREEALAMHDKVTGGR